MTRATTAKLAPGEDSIDRSTATLRADGRWRLQWTMTLPNGQKYRGDSTGATKGEARRRARERADELRRSGAGAWRTTHRLADYIEQVSIPAMAKADLSDLTRMRYDLSMRWLLGDCDRHKHRHSLKNHTIGSGIRFQSLEDLLTEIARDHGLETAKQCRTVLTRYIITRLIREEVISGNPIGGVKLVDLTGVKKAERLRGGRALTLSQVQAVLDYLLALDPSDGVRRRQGRWGEDVLIAKRRNAIDQMLLQLATGLRSTEANMIDWSHVKVDDEGVMSIEVTKRIAKGGDPRVALVLMPQVAERLLRRKAHAKGKGRVIGAPADPRKMWEARARNKAAAELYVQVARDLDIDVMLSERSHLWRTTLRSLYEGRASAAVLNSQFGHSQRTADKHYTDASDLSGLATAAGLGAASNPDKIPDSERNF